MFVLGGAVILILADFLYERVPEIQSFQIQFLRSIFSVMITMSLNCGHIKERVWDKLPPGKMKLMLLRCVLATIVQVTNLTIVKYFSLVFQGIARNMTPIVTILLSQVLIGESVSCFDISFTLVSLIGVVFIIAGGF